MFHLLSIYILINNQIISIFAADYPRRGRRLFSHFHYRGACTEHPCFGFIPHRLDRPAQHAQCLMVPEVPCRVQRGYRLAGAGFLCDHFEIFLGMFIISPLGMNCMLTFPLFIFHKAKLLKQGVKCEHIIITAVDVDKFSKNKRNMYVF